MSDDVTQPDSVEQTNQGQGGDDYAPVLNSIRKPRRPLTVVPTFVPKTFADQIQVFDDGINPKAIYVYISGTWVGFQQNATPLDVTQQFTDLIPWNSLDGWTTGGTATISPQGNQVLFNVPNGGTATLVTKSAYQLLFATGKAVTF